MNFGNLAYKLPEERPKRPPQKKRKKKQVRRTKQMALRNKMIRRVCVIAAVAVSASFMISQFVAVNEGDRQIASLRKQLADTEAATSQMVFDMEQSVDLAEIEKQATTRLGMQRPEKYQIIYVNVKQDDMTEKTAGEVEGTGNRIMNMIKGACGYIVNFFSIK